MTKKNKKILKIVLYIVLLAVIVIPVANAIKSNAATWTQVNACYVTNTSVQLKASASSTATTLTTIPANTYIYVININGSWGKTAYNGNKGYIDLSNATRKASAPATSGEVEKRLEAVQLYYGNGSVWKGSQENTTSGTYVWSTGYAGGPYECFGFANEVWRALFGCEMARAYSGSARYQLASNANMKLVSGTYLYPNAYGAAEVKALLSQARPGDVIQACISSGTSGQHSMIVDSVGADGIYIYDANANGTYNGIRTSAYYTWEAFANYRKGGMGLYTYVNYPPSTAVKVTGGDITVKNSAGSAATSFYLGDKISFSASISNATSITYYVVEKNSNKVVSQYTSTSASYSYTFSALTSNSTEYYVYYKASNAASSVTSNKKYFTVLSPSVSISGGAVTIFVGQTQTLTATKAPASGTLAWTSSNINVATVNASGVVTAKAAGTADITVTLSYKGTGGITIRTKATVQVTVKNQMYTVTLNPNGGSVSKTSIKVENTRPFAYHEGLPTPTREGYDFAGWYTAASGGTLITANTTVNLSANITLYAHWNPKTYTVSFAPNGAADENGNKATVSQTSKTVTYDSTYGTLPVPVWPGHTFDGWYTAASGGTKITALSAVKITANQTLYAHWTVSSYTVTFNANGGKASAASKSVTYLSTYGELPTATRVGYTFAGWFTAPSGGTMITKDSKVAITSNITLHAHWVPNTYKVSFNTNGGSMTATTKTVTYDAEYGTLPMPTRKGYSFTGWYTAAEGGNKIVASSKVAITSDITLYAHWEPGSFTVSFNANGGTSLTDSKSVVYLTTYGALPIPTKTGYTFEGWFTASVGGTQILETTPVNITEDQTLFAHWSVNAYNVSFETGSKESSFESKRVTFDSPYGELPIPVRTGYTFDGWYTLKEEGLLITEDSILKIGEDSTLYAHWIPNKYNVSFDVNGGDSEAWNIQVAFELPYGDMPLPIKRGYVFEGWYTEATGGEHITSDSIVENPFDIVLYAHWSAKKINITFDPAGGEASFESKTVVFDSLYGALPSATRVGYSFVGWRTEDGVVISSSEIVQLTDDSTIYAQWKALSFIIGFDLNGGSLEYNSALADKIVTYDDEYPDLYTPYKYGYRFIGWKTADGNHAYSGDVVKITSSQKLVADWAPLMFTVTLDVQGGEISTDSLKVEFGSDYGMIPTPVRVGYTFDGWKNSSEIIITETSKVINAENHTLTAMWHANEYTLHFVSSGNAQLDVMFKKVTYDSRYGELPVPIKAGYKFVKWTDADGKTVIAEDVVKITSDIDLTAVWAPMSYEVTFDGKGSQLVIPPMIVTYDSAYGTLPEAQRPGYIFDGWYLDGVEITSESIVKITSDTTLEAHWIAIVYDVIFDHNGGKCDVDNMDFTCDQLYEALPEITRQGYNFIGWFDADGNMVTENMPVRPVDKQVFTAHWSPVEYNVYFNINGVIDTSMTMEVAYNSEYGTLPEINADGYKFMYWADENGNRVNAEDIYTSVSDKTLYAVINMNSFHITFYADGGEPEYSHKKVYYNDTFGKLPESVKMGYMFAGWYTEDGRQITEDSIVKFTEDTVLYAHWIKIEANTAMVLNGNDMLVTGCEVVAGVNLLILGFTSLRKKKESK